MARKSSLAAWWGVPLVLGTLFLVGVVVYGLWTTGHPGGRLATMAGLAALIGTSVGAAEILLRYRDEPFLALTTPPALAYLALNGLISLACFSMLLRYGDRLLAGIGGDLLLSSLAAGFGGMILARSKLFTYPGESGTENSFGPAIVLETFLRTLDRKIDRLRSAARQERVFACVQQLEIDQDAFDFALHYLEASLLSYQNLSQAEKTTIAKEIDSYRTLLDWPLLLRMLAVGFAVLNLVGEANFGQVMEDLKAALANRNRNPHPPATPPGGS